ncbi:MAG: isoprenylcysteine carboxylmethyltransferase family protein [Deltaproteobacteria bacterium]|nr:isoprenylcysteine carboxylmethyltransferase family protein [Deltaproteobacteria bacterium]
MTAYAGYFLLALGWIAFAVLHSMLISVAVTNAAQKWLGRHFRFYRLFYNAVALTTITPLLWYTARTAEPAFFIWDGPLLWLKWLIQLSGVLLFAAALRHYSFLHLLGARQILAVDRPIAAIPGGGIVSTGILGLIRHPFYSGALLLIWAQDLDGVHLMVNIILTVYVIIGTRLEERKLILEFGDEYIVYRRQVSMFFPWRWIMGKLPRLSNLPQWHARSAEENRASDHL